MATKKTNTCAIGQIETPIDLYPRTKLPGEKDVQHLLGVDFPPIATAQVKFVEDEGLETIRTVLVDGAHRLEAARIQGFKEIECEDLGLLEETEVLNQAIRRNRAHGKQLSMADKAKLARIYATEGWKVAAIQGQLSVGERSVSRWVSEAKEAKKLSDYAKVVKLVEKGCTVAGAARDVGVARSTAQGWIDNPPEAKDRTPKSKDKDGPGLTKNPAEAECPDRVEALAQVIIEDAHDLSKEMEESSWIEIAEAVIKTVRASYPKSWKV